MATCSACDLNYQLYNNTCIDIPTSENCLKKDGNNCSNCKIGFMKVNGQCVSPQPFELENCAQDNLDGTTSDELCLKCDTNHYPWVISSICQQNQNPIAHCVKHFLDNGTKCATCED
ncbi:MAG: hypothetical protein GY938_03055 [Ketobacter sp.]|nr:hypothetical protein [Ketobacter sp.]